MTCSVYGHHGLITESSDGVAYTNGCNDRPHGSPQFPAVAERSLTWSGSSTNGSQSRSPPPCCRTAAAHRSLRRRPPSSRPVASSSQVRGSVSTTFGGLPRVCSGPEMHCTATNGGTRTSTLAPGAIAASVRAVRPHRLGQLGAAGSGQRCRRAASPTTAAPRRGSSPDRHCGGRPYLRFSKCSSTATDPPYKTAGAVFLVIVSAIAAFIYLQFRGDSHPQDAVDAAVVAGGPGGRTGVEGDLQRGGDRPGLRASQWSTETARPRPD